MSWSAGVIRALMGFLQLWVGSAGENATKACTAGGCMQNRPDHRPAAPSTPQGAQTARRLQARSRPWLSSSPVARNFDPFLTHLALDSAFKYPPPPANLPPSSSHLSQQPCALLLTRPPPMAPTAMPPTAPATAPTMATKVSLEFSPHTTPIPPTRAHISP